MKFAVICLGVLGLAIAAHGQTVQAPDAGKFGFSAKYLERISDTKTLAKGGVEIQLGTTIIRADEADIQCGTPNVPCEFELRGKVHVTADFRGLPPAK